MAPGDERGKLKRGSVISLGRLQYIRRVNRRLNTEEEQEEQEEEEEEELVIFLNTDMDPLIYLLAYLLTCSLHGEEFFLRR
jgi:hypothetical protein